LDKTSNFFIMFVLTFLVSASASTIFTKVFDLNYIYILFTVSGLVLIIFVYLTVGKGKKKWRKK